MKAGIYVEASKPSLESALAVAGAVTEILAVAGKERTPESALVKALEVVGRALQGAPLTVMGGSVDQSDTRLEAPLSA